MDHRTHLTLDANPREVAELALFVGHLLLLFVHVQTLHKLVFPCLYTKPNKS